MRILVIARLTFREAIRRKIALTALILGLLFLLLFNLGFFFIVRQVSAEPFMPVLAVRNLYSSFQLAGLYAANFLSIAMAALVSADTLAGEISSGTIQSVACKPLRRVEIVIGKWLGFAGLLSLYLGLLAGGLILSVWLQTGFLPPQPVVGLALMLFGCLIMMTVTLAFSSTLSTLATGGAVFGLYGVAFIGSWVEQIGSYINNSTAIQIGIVSSLIMPSEALWRRAAHEMTTALVQMVAGGPFTSRSVPSDAMIIYAGLYLLIALGAAVYLFNHRDL